MSMEERREAAREKARVLREEQRVRKLAEDRRARIGRFTLFVGVGLILLCILLWVTAIWVGGPDGNRLGGTGGILIIPSIIIAVVGGVFWAEFGGD